MGNTPSRKNRKLEKAIQARKVKRVKRWLLKGADPNSYSKKSNYSFLSMAITLREEAIVTTLIQHGADPDQKSWLTTGKGTLQRRQANDDEYPIHIAASHGSEKIMKALLKSSININIGQDHKLGTALHQASRFGHSKLTELLLSHGADIIGIDSRLNIPLHIAATYGQIKVAEVLLRYGSPVNTSNMKNWSPLHHASSEGAVSMVKLLLRHGANPKAKDGTGSTPTDLAKSELVLEAFLEHAIDNPDEEIFKDEHNTETDEKTTDQPGPPKPARTFALSSSALKGSFKKRERAYSQEMALESKTHKQLEKSNTYNNFGHWKRKQKATELVKQPNVHEQNKIEQASRASNFRRTKSTPMRRKNVRQVENQNENTHRKVDRSTSHHPIGRRIQTHENSENESPQINFLEEKKTKDQPKSPNLRRAQSTPLRKKHAYPQTENVRTKVERSMTHHPIGLLGQENIRTKPQINLVHEKQSHEQHRSFHFRRTKSTPLGRKRVLHPDPIRSENVHRKVERSMTHHPIIQRLIQQENNIETEPQIHISDRNQTLPVTIFRRTKSTPVKKKPRRQRTKPQSTPFKETVVRSNSVKMSIKEPTEFKRMYSVRYASKPSQFIDENVETFETVSEEDLPKVHKRSKSVPTLTKKWENKRAERKTEKEESNHIDTDKMTKVENISSQAQKSPETEIDIAPQKQNFSHSLHDLTAISEDTQNGDITRDANYNFTSKHNVNRTMSDRFSYRLNHLKNSFVRQRKNKKFIKQ